jgi:hypothetical protein
VRADAGGGGPEPVWTGRIDVVPGDLEASAPAFSAASDQVTNAQIAMMCWQDGAGTGITNPAAAAAWSRLARIWTGDLGDLSNFLADISGQLSSAGAEYTYTDHTVIP